MLIKKTGMIILFVLLVVGMLGVVSVNAQDSNASLTVIHGIPGLGSPVDVYANGALLFSFDYGDIQGPLSLAPGQYDLEVRLNGVTVLSLTATLVARTKATVIAHMTWIDGSQRGIKLSQFLNNVYFQEEGATRLTVRHTADAPLVDVRVSSTASALIFRALELTNFQNLKPMQFGAVDVPTGRFNVDLIPSDTNTSVLSAGPLDLAVGIHYIVYAVGSVTQGNLALIIQTIALR